MASAISKFDDLSDADIDSLVNDAIPKNTKKAPNYWRRHFPLLFRGILAQYCKIREDQPGPLFCQLDNHPISVNQYNSELKRCLAFCGLNTQRYKSHSFRIGAACFAAEKGFSDAQIRALGRWKSDAFKLYISYQVAKLLTLQ